MKISFTVKYMIEPIFKSRVPTTASKRGLARSNILISQCHQYIWELARQIKSFCSEVLFNFRVITNLS